MKSRIAEFVALAILIVPFSLGATPIVLDGEETVSARHDCNHIASSCGHNARICEDTLLGGYINLERWIWAGTGRSATMYASLTPFRVRGQHS